jgi:ubiquinone/menaquinone biosynthesis C-methylase UbiE
MGDSEVAGMAGAQVEPPGGRAEHEVYTRRFLAVYDALVLGVYLRWVWRCPRAVLVERYRLHVCAGHLDVGPGTGYFLAAADLPEGTAITLLDPNPEVLAHASRRLAAHAPVTVLADACEPFRVEGPVASAAPPRG